jgi:hypothetical protein
MGNLAFVVHFGHTMKVNKRMAKHVRQTSFAMCHSPRTAKKCCLTAGLFATAAAGFAVRLLWRRTTKSEVFAMLL